MRIEYETTLDEIADAHIRAIWRSKLARRTRWQSTIWVAVLTSAALFFLLSFEGATIAERLFFCGLGAAVGAAGYWLTYRWSIKRRVFKYLREKMKPEVPLHFAVELRDDCIWTRLGRTQLAFDWSNLAEIFDCEDGIELPMRDGGFVIVRNKGFPSPEARQEFMKIVQERKERDPGKATAEIGMIP